MAAAALPRTTVVTGTSSAGSAPWPGTGQRLALQIRRVANDWRWDMSATRRMDKAPEREPGFNALTVYLTGYTVKAS
jgi:hypothetical protein